MQSTRTNLIHSLKTHCFNCMKQSCKLQVIFYLREFCSLDTDSIKFLMSWSNQCHKNVWIYYYYYCIFEDVSTKLKVSDTLNILTKYSDWFTIEDIVSNVKLEIIKQSIVTILQIWADITLMFAESDFTLSVHCSDFLKFCLKLIKKTTWNLQLWISYSCYQN